MGVEGERQEFRGIEWAIYWRRGLDLVLGLNHLGLLRGGG
jgi:hypothetical protein